MISFALQVPVSSAWTWYTAMVSAQEYFMEFTSAQNVSSSLFAYLMYLFMQMYACMNVWDIMCNV